MATSLRPRRLAAPRCVQLFLVSCVVQTMATPELTFSLIAPIWDYGVCCQTEFFDRMLQSMRLHPAFREEPKDAAIVFLAIDTLRQCEWPEFEMGKYITPEGEVTDLPGPGCAEGSGAGAFEAPFVAADQYTCDWCCKFGVDQWLNTVRNVSNIYGTNKTFVYFRNSQDNYHDCNEFKYAKVALAKLPVNVRFVGFQLQTSMLTQPQDAQDSSRYPLAGINLLTPLHPLHDNMVLSDEERMFCDLDNRDFLASFSGHVDPDGLRNKVFELKETPGTERFHLFATGGFHLEDKEIDYEELLRRSIFAYAPRGDEHYSFRLTEVLAAGAIPVLIDDDYAAPYGEQDISEWAVRVPENDVRSSVDIINSMTEDQICSLKRNGTKIWNKARDMDAMVNAMIEALWRSLPASSAAGSRSSESNSDLGNSERGAMDLSTMAQRNKDSAPLRLSDRRHEQTLPRLPSPVMPVVLPLFAGAVGVGALVLLLTLWRRRQTFDGFEAVRCGASHAHPAPICAEWAHER